MPSTEAHFAIQGPCALAKHSILLRCRRASELANRRTKLQYPWTSRSSIIALLLCLGPHIAATLRLHPTSRPLFLPVLLHCQYWPNFAIAILQEPAQLSLSICILFGCRYPCRSCFAIRHDTLIHCHLLFAVPRRPSMFAKHATKQYHNHPS